MVIQCAQIILVVISSSLFLIGSLALIFPAKSSEMFGVRADSQESVALVRAMGARDLAFAGLGVFFFCNLPLASNAWFVLVMASFSAVDGFITYSYRSPRWRMHAVSVILLVAFFIFLRSA
jgi:hypothetical protein